MTRNSQTNSQRLPLIVGTVFMVVGGLIASGGVVLSLEIKDLLDNGERTEGKVLYIERSSSSYYPVFAFQDQRGRKFQARSPDSSRSHASGDKVEVVYDPKEPLSARIIDIASYWPSVFIVLFGSLFLSIGSVVALFRNRFDENGEWVFGRKKVLQQ